MKQAYFAALDRATKLLHTPNHSGLFQPPAGALPLSIQGEIQPCAASSGVTYEQLAAFQPLVGYVPPPGITQPEEAPVTLSLLNTHHSGRILSHGGLANPIDGFPIHSFTHVLLDVPATLDAHQAIQTWGSEQWQRSAADGLGELNDALFPPVSTALDDDALTRFLEDAEHRDLFQFILAAVVSSSPETRIFVAAPSDKVALCIYGVTRALPAPLLDALTFTTYEHEPLKSTAKIVGALPDGQERELPPACYDGAGIGINTFTGTKTSLDVELPYVEFAVQLLSSGNVAPLEEFKATWQRLGLRDGGLLDVVYRLGRGADAITKAEASKALQDPPVAAWVAPRAEHQQQFLNWALEDIDFATIAFPRVVAALRQKPDHLTKLADVIHKEGTTAIGTGDLARTRCALEVLLPMVSPALGQAVWGEILQKQADPEALSWEMRSYLLPKLARLRPLAVGQVPDADLRRWLRHPAEKLSALLAMSLSQGYQTATCMEMLQADRENLPAVARAVSTNQSMVLTLIQQLTNSAGGTKTANDLFAAVLQEAPGAHWLEEVIKLQPQVPVEFLNRSIGAALDAGTPAVEPVAFVRKYGSVLLDRLTGQENLDRLAGQVLKGESGELLSDESVRSFFLGLEGKPGLSQALEDRLAAVLSVHRYLELPNIQPERLDEVADALKVDPPAFAEGTKAQLLRAATETMGSTTFQEDLVALLLSWGPVFGGPSALYREILRRFQENKGFWKNNDQMLAFLAIALDATSSDELNSQTEGLEAEAYAIVEGMVKRGGKKQWNEMNARTAEWPRAARRQWQFLSQAVMPEKGRGIGRDFTAGLIGAALVAIAFVVLRWLKML